MDKVVFFRPKANERRRIIVTPLQLISIAGTLEKSGFSCRIIDADLDKDYKEKIVAECSNAVCFALTAMTGYQIKNGLEVSRLVKEKFPKLPVIWGGWHPSIAFEETIKNENIDFVVRGQGEHTFLELVKAIKKGGGFSKINGIVLKQNGKTIVTDWREFEDINTFPPLAYHLIDVEKYIKERGGPERTIEYRSSQGCPHNCTFCAESRMSKRRWSALRAERVVLELEQLVKKYNIEKIVFFENNFFLDLNRAKAIFRGLAERNIRVKMENLNATVRSVLRFDDELLSLMRQAGCTNILLGVESGSQKILDLTHKSLKVEEVIEAKKKLSKYNIMPYISLIVGFPFEEVKIGEELEKTFLLIEKLQAIDKNNFYFINLYTSYPGTELYQQCIEKGMLKEKSLEDWAATDLTTVSNPWLEESYGPLLETLNNYVLPYLTHKSKEDWENFSKNIVLKKALSLAHAALSTAAEYRFRQRFFSFPLEFWLFKSFGKMQGAK